MLISEATELPELVVLPGGMPGAKNLRNSDAVCRHRYRDLEEGWHFIAAICSSPFYFGRTGAS